MARVNYTSPLFQHDCDCCAFLAHVIPSEGSAFDLYQHGNNVLARVSSEGPDFHCMPADLAPHFEGRLGTVMGRAFWMHQHLTRKRFACAA